MFHFTYTFSDLLLVREIQPNDFVVISLLYDQRRKSAQVQKYFLAHVIEADNLLVKVKFLRRVQNRSTFYFPAIEDIMDIKKENVILVFKTSELTHRRGYYSIVAKGKCVNLLLRQSIF